MTAAIEARVREAAVALHDAILEARAAGLRITWPAAPAALPNIAISATAKAVEPVVAPPAPAAEPEPEPVEDAPVADPPPKRKRF